MKDATDYLAHIKALIILNPQVVHWTVVREEAQGDLGLFRYRLTLRDGGLLELFERFQIVEERLQVTRYTVFIGRMPMVSCASAGITRHTIRRCQHILITFMITRKQMCSRTDQSALKTSWLSSLQKELTERGNRNAPKTPLRTPFDVPRVRHSARCLARRRRLFSSRVVRRPTHDQLSRLYPIGRTQPHRDSLWSQHPDTLRDALAACFRRADQVIHSRSTGSRSTRQLLGESYAIAGDVERAAASCDACFRGTDML